MTDWLKQPYYTPPAPLPQYYLDGAFVNVRFAIDYGMGLAIDGDLKDPNNKFNNSPNLDAKYHDPIAYAKSLVEKAEALGVEKKYYTPDGWNAVESGLQYANVVFAKLQQIPCNRGDEASNNLFDSWVAGTGQNYGGHVPAPASTGDGVNAGTGQSVAPPNSIL